MRPYHKWTTEVDDMLRQMFEAGCNVREMSKAVNRPTSQIYARLYSLDLQLSNRIVEPNLEEFKRIMHLRTGKEY